MFQKKTQKDMEISRLRKQLHKYQQLRNFNMPQYKRRLFKKDEVESISDDRDNRIVDYDKKIINLKQKIADLQDT